MSASAVAGPADVPLRSRADFERAIADAGPRRAYEALIARRGDGVDSWVQEGWCAVCRAAVPLGCDWASSDGSAPNWRERLVCPHCGLNNRQRHLAGRLRRDVPTYLLEQVTAFHAWAVGALEDVVGSEYLGEDLAPGQVVDGIRHEDLHGLSFADGRFGQVVSNDVFEHVPDIARALSEVARVLAPGGRLWFSIPFHPLREATVRRAELRGGSVHHLEPAQFHGNPVDAEAGSLVFSDFGWDLLDACRDAGFADAYAVGYWSALHGYLGDGLQLAFCAERA